MKNTVRSTTVDTFACPSALVLPPVSSIEVIDDRESVAVQHSFPHSLPQSQLSRNAICQPSPLVHCNHLAVFNNPNVNICLSLAANIVFEASIFEVSNKIASAVDELLSQQEK